MVLELRVRTKLVEVQTDAQLLLHLGRKSSERAPALLKWYVGPLAVMIVTQSFPIRPPDIANANSNTPFQFHYKHSQSQKS